MKIIKILAFISVAVTLGQLNTSALIDSNYSWDLWYSYSKFKQTVSHNLRGQLPTAYRVEFFFEGESYQHTHTVNDGVYPVHVKVVNKSRIISAGALKQLHYEVFCYLGANGFGGDVVINRTETIVGEEDSDAQLNKRIRKNIINILLKEIGRR